MNELEELRDGGEELWAKMVRAKCQYCKHFDNDKHAGRSDNTGGYVFVLSSDTNKGESLSSFCNLRSWLSLETLQAQECRHYKWDSRLTKHDFKELG